MTKENEPAFPQEGVANSGLTKLEWATITLMAAYRALGLCNLSAEGLADLAKKDARAALQATVVFGR